MISVSDLLKWADEHAIGRSPSYPRGWVSAKDILVLARLVEAQDPLNFYYSVRSNTAEEKKMVNPQIEKPQTNYDRIISKTPEELAETYAGGCPNGDRLNCGKYYLHGGRDCFNCWLDWLKSPVEVNNG